MMILGSVTGAIDNLGSDRNNGAGHRMTLLACSTLMSGARCAVDEDVPRAAISLLHHSCIVLCHYRFVNVGHSGFYCSRWSGGRSSALTEEWWWRGDFGERGGGQRGPGSLRRPRHP